jgi:RNA polymerase sigma-70 factor (ECF subfamily)
MKLVSNEGPLVDRARAGDERAFADLVRGAQQQVYRLALGMLHDSGAAEDVAQETFLRAYRYLSTFRSDAAFSTWVYRIAVNLCIDVARKRRSYPLEPLNDEDSVADDAGADPEATVGAREALAHVEEALQWLSPDHRAILLLRELEGLSYEQIARVLQIPKGTVMSRLFHARMNLQRQCRRMTG